MAKRWVLGTLLGALASWGTPAEAFAQGMGDAVPAASSGVFSGFGEGGMGGPSPAGAYGVPAPYSMASCPPPPGGYGPPRPGVSFGSEPGCDTGCGKFFVDFGWLMLKRNPYNTRPFVVADVSGFDTGNPADPTQVNLFRLNDVGIPWNNGFQVNFGVQQEDVIYEFAGWYVPNRGAARFLSGEAGLSSFFVRPPLGFEGNAGMWQQADTMRFDFRQNSASGAFNAKIIGPCDCEEFRYSLLVGLRYVDLWERLDYTVDDDAIRFGSFPGTIATLTYQTTNRLMGPQVGFDLNYAVNSWFGIEAMGRLGFMTNLMTIRHTLTRGDGFQGFDTSIQRAEFTQLYETGVHLYLYSGNMRLKGGYDFKWFVGTAKTDNQINFDLETQPTTFSTTGTLFFHGPSVSLEIFF